MKAAKKKQRDKLIKAYQNATTDTERAQIEADARAYGVTLEDLLGRRR